VSQRDPPRVNASVNQSMLTGSRTILTRVFAYGSPRVKLSSQTEIQQAGCNKVSQRDLRVKTRQSISQCSQGVVQL